MTHPAILTVLMLTGGQPLSEQELSGRVEQLTQEVTPSVVEWRRDFHAHPELGNREERTAKKVAEQLRAMGVDDLKTGVARHGVVALIRGRRTGPTVALRADMDALPILEQTGLPFASQQPDVMHACGHDAHTAMLLGAARVLVQLRDHVPGSVKLIFQPAEEGLPAGETGGARQMVKEKVLENPEVAALFALHISPELDAGKIGYRTGPMAASVERIRITVTGKQSHAAMPWQGVDPIVTAAEIITGLQTVRSRGTDARKPIVVSISVVKGGTAWNIIPGQVFMEGTIRTYDDDVRRTVLEQCRRIVEHTALAHGATAQFSCETYGPAVCNDPELGKRMKPTVMKVVGEGNLVEVEPSMGGDDFAYFAEKKPGLYLSLGVRNKAIGAVGALHAPQMILDEAALPLGVRTFVMLAVDFLNGEAGNAAEAAKRE